MPTETKDTVAETARRQKSSSTSKPDSKTLSGPHAGLDRKQLIDLYRWIYTSRRTDDMERKLKSQMRIYFQINGAGHEAVLAALGLVVRPGVDWFYCYYRDRALMLPLGMTPKEMILDAVASSEGPSSGGRQMPSHWGLPKVNVVTKSSCTGTQFLQSVGCAQAGRYMANNPRITPDKIAYDPEEFTVVTGGDGTTSEGEFFEAINVACLETNYGQLPVLFLIEDNGYAISVPKMNQTAGGSISQFLMGLKDSGKLEILEIDGCDPIASYAAFRSVEHRLRVERKPVLIHANVIRPYSHSESDDERLYKTEQMREEEQKRDPIHNYPRYLVEHGIATEAELQKLRDEIDEEINEAAEYAIQAPRCTPESAPLYVYSDKIDASSDDFEAEPHFDGGELTMIQGINKTLFDEMEKNPAILVFGEDVADVGDPKLLGKVPGKGGVFKATIGLMKEYGSLRVYNSQLAEATIVGTATGLATRGLKPVGEIQFGDYIWPAFMQLVDETAKIRWRSNNQFSCPAVIRVAVGGYLGGSGAVYHSQSIEATFAHIPGLLIAFPSTALDAIGLLRTALRCDDPVLFLEHKRLYRQPILKSRYPGPEFTIPFGRARIARPGDHLTVVTYGATTLKANTAAAKMAADGISAEVIDLRTIIPWDQETVAESVRKTGKVLVLHEDVRLGGFGGEIAAWIGEELFDDLDAPVRRMGALDTPVGYGPELENAILPQDADIEKAMRELAAY
ncbi:MAG: dehydrogenase E1 component subunit alpha/beta [Candidatus Zixiibacteriota bacterium]